MIAEPVPTSKTFSLLGVGIQPLNRGYIYSSLFRLQLVDSNMEVSSLDYEGDPILNIDYAQRMYYGSLGNYYTNEVNLDLDYKPFDLKAELGSECGVYPYGLACSKK